MESSSALMNEPQGGERGKSRLGPSLRPEPRAEQPGCIPVEQLLAGLSQAQSTERVRSPATRGLCQQPGSGFWFQLLCNA